MVQSTNCRGCSVYLKVDHGKVIAPSKDNSQPRYAKPSAEYEDSNPADAPVSKPLPAVPQSNAKAVPATAAPVPKKKLSPLPTLKEKERQAQPEQTSAAEEQPALLPSAPSVAAEPTEEDPLGKQSELFPETAEILAADPVKEKRPLPLAAIPSTDANPPTREEEQEPPAAPSPDAITHLSRPSFLANRPIKPKAPPPPPKPKPIAPDDRAPELEEAPTASQRYRPQPSETPPPEQHSSLRIAPLINREKKRSVRCFDCDGEHEILADSTSALCPKCGAYIGLKSYDIRDRSNSRIQTRGNVFVHKKGEVTGITIQCHNLTIEGQIQGGAECSGDFIIRKTGKVNGPVTSERVIVERRAIVDFMSGVVAKEVIIDGEVTGAVTCKKLVLKKRATLDGDLSVSSLSIEEGARHTGNIKMTGA